MTKSCQSVTFVTSLFPARQPCFQPAIVLSSTSLLQSRSRLAVVGMTWRSRVILKFEIHDIRRRTLYRVIDTFSAVCDTSRCHVRGLLLWEQLSLAWTYFNRDMIRSCFQPTTIQSGQGVLPMVQFWAVSSNHPSTQIWSLKWAVSPHEFLLCKLLQYWMFEFDVSEETADRRWWKLHLLALKGRLDLVWTWTGYL